MSYTKKRSTRRTLQALLLATLSSAACLLWLSPSRASSDNKQATVSPLAASSRAANGKIVFASNRGNGDAKAHDIYVMNPDGSVTTRLTAGARDNRDPAWSPDGSKIAYSAGPPSAAVPPFTRTNVFVMNADGGNVKKLTDTSGAVGDYGPAWS
ncbi:MAG TPA: hypothetical protein VF507_06180, partial [Pyrinomonadaceae bacterium]